MLAVLALGSGAGLVALVLVSLLQSSERVRAEAELDAVMDARLVARQWRERLGDPAVLQSDLPGLRCAAQDGRLVVPDEVGWLEPEGRREPRDAMVEAKLALAAQKEFQEGDANAAAAVLASLREPGGPLGVAGLEVRAAAAWVDHRRGDAVATAALLHELDAALQPLRRSAMADSALAAVVARVALLHEARGEAVEPWCVALVFGIEPERAGPVLARIAPGEAAQQRLGSISRARADHFRLWRLVAGRARGVHAVSGDGEAAALLCWFPDRGALLVPLDELLATRGDPRAPFVAGNTQPEHGEVVVEGVLAVVPRALEEPGFFARPAGIGVATASLGSLFLLSLWLWIRLLHRDALLVRTRADFLTVVTHELKTPLASIRLLAEMLQEGRVPDGKHGEYYRSLAGEAARLSMLIENVLDLGRLERGERARDLRECDAAALVREACVLFAPVAERDGMAVHVDIADGEVPALADRNALHQALLNVLDNARKYAAAGGRIDVDARVVGRTFEVAVQDRGNGVPIDEREAIFERFRRGQAHQNGAIPGVGLGLHLARAIARQHGGDLVCTDPVSSTGARFVLSIPLAAARTVASSPHPSPSLP